MKKKWIDNIKNNSEFAKNHNIDEKTVRLIKENKDYHTSLETIESICEAENLNLSQFFKEVEEMFPEVRMDHQ
ncbi:transcriptional regulator [Gillisia sp. Hel1_33_143]|uniref:transcriptional regulator n=1 Tax=Gillisia sp. Hel1_33_143 TaxID=1336796 RepID=UPI0012FDD7BD|nr:transcriptional regulator [Gillisia sp. Hel1_33_143]